MKIIFLSYESILKQQNCHQLEKPLCYKGFLHFRNHLSVIKNQGDLSVEAYTWACGSALP